MDFGDDDPPLVSTKILDFILYTAGALTCAIGFGDAFGSIPTPPVGKSGSGI
jgi:hypothetical protein